MQVCVYRTKINKLSQSKQHLSESQWQHLQRTHLWFFFCVCAVLTGFDLHSLTNLKTLRWVVAVGMLSGS